MRIVATIPHPRIAINIFSMNDKFQIKFEAGQMEQIFKISHSEINGIEGIKKMMDEKFIQNVLDRFNEMYLSFKNCKERNSESNS